MGSALLHNHPMAEIKSALEIALARTEGMEMDKDKLRAKEQKVSGRKAALSFLDGKLDSKEFSKMVKKEKGGMKEAFIAGAAGSFMSVVKLPSDSDFSEGLAMAAEGLAALSDDPKDIRQMFEQLNQFFGQYLQNREQLEKQLIAQFEPILKQKEEALAAQTGSRIKLEPMDDPDFQKAYSQNIGGLNKNYLEALEQAKGQLKEFLGLKE